MDRFYTGKPDSQNTAAARFCGDCGSELYSGDMAFCCYTEVICEKCFYGMLNLIEEECRVDVYQ